MHECTQNPPSAPAHLMRRRGEHVMPQPTNQRAGFHKLHLQRASERTKRRKKSSGEQRKRTKEMHDQIELEKPEFRPQRMRPEGGEGTPVARRRQNQEN
ncbi:hypothetical protein AVEN_188005-1 [Araneus ventricosus]|uniref:Uncharacterized protein n=1 Tax=Araneus ventricosus TaxID=182803 RepID=A0A4Y2HPV5_ARAVE|nr:hypothetical protein AVEN_188005-1 [Araneus ventricosus]